MKVVIILQPFSKPYLLPRAAIHWLKQWLAIFSGTGSALKKNSVEAFKWLRKAAEQGFAEAQFSVGHYYDLGDGVPVNKVRAYMWYSLAVAQGNEIAAPPLQYLDEHMSSSDISKAQELAIDWWEKHNN